MSPVIINGEMGFIHMHIQSSKRVHTFPILKKKKKKKEKKKEKEKDSTPFPCLQIWSHVAKNFDQDKETL